MIETGLKSYSSEELNTTNLPENIQEIGNLVESLEKTGIDTQLGITADTYSELTKTAKEPVDICVAGSNAMYLLFENLRSDGDKLQVLKQRYQRGKNDLDFGLASEKARRGNEIWDFKNWTQNEDKHSGGHGAITVEGKSVPVDLLQRPQLRGFEWIETKYKGKVLKTQTPEEMIFEKVRSLARPSIARIQLKWGIDVKLLKYYMIKTQGFESDEKLDEYLSKRWEEYQDSQKELDAIGLIKQRTEGESYHQLVSRVLNQPVNQLNEHLAQSTNCPIVEIQQLLESRNDEAFVKGYVELLRKDKSRLTYKQVLEKANNNFSTAVRSLEE